VADESMIALNHHLSAAGQIEVTKPLDAMGGQGRRRGHGIHINSGLGFGAERRGMLARTKGLR
jgi:hypothetical protein